MQEGLGTMLYHRLKGDRAIWLIVALLTVLSLLAVYSATGSWAYVKKGGNTEYFLVKQFTLIASGLFLMWVCYRIHYTRYSRLELRRIHPLPGSIHPALCAGTSVLPVPATPCDQSYS